MLRAVPSLLAAILIALASVGSAQQKTHADPTPVITDAPPTADVRPMPPPRPTPAPVPPALRHGLSGSIASLAAPPPAPKATPTPPVGSVGLSSSGAGAGGVLRDADGDSEVWLASEGYGIRSFGLTVGGEFGNLTGSTHAYLAVNQLGIQALGREMGGSFIDTNASGYAAVAYGDIGVYANGNEAGGFFVDSDSSGYAFVGYGDSGIWASGDALGGYFMVPGLSGRASVATGDLGISAQGNTAGGFFEDSDSSGYGYVGNGDYGMRGFGNTAGGYFKDADNSGYGYIGFGNDGVRGSGSNAGGYFEDSDSSGYASVGYGDFGISAYGNTAGAFFKDGDGTSYAYIGNESYGIRAYSQVIGGFFSDSDGSGTAYVAYDRTSGTDALGVPNAGEYGAYASGDFAGGYFEDSDQGSHAYAGNGGYGVRAVGISSGGYFRNFSDANTRTFVGYDRTSGTDADLNPNTGQYGIHASGVTAGGYFEDSNYTSYAYIGRGNEGVFGVGTFMGGYFGDKDESGYAYLGYSDYGVYAGGHFTGGYFTDYNGGAYASVGRSSYKILGTGSVDFVQNHPRDPEAVIVYAAPEGDEVATYTRGTARLVDGEATVPLGDTFRWVTNPDIGLTTYLTPVGEWSDLYVAERTTEEIVVRSAGGAPNATFDYIVYGLRIGFEETSVVQEKEQEAYIPAMTDHRELYARRPELRRFNSLERFKGMHEAVTKSAELDLSRARALRDAIGEFDPAVHALPLPPGVERPDGDPQHAPRTATGAPDADGRSARTRSATDERRDAGVIGGDIASIPVDDDGNVYATSFRPSSEDLASLVALSEPVEPGDVLVIDRERPGLMRRAIEASDSGVVGVVAAAPGLVLGTKTRTDGDPPRPDDDRTRTPASSDLEGTQSLQAPAAFAGVVRCKVDAGYGAIWPGDLLVTSPTPGHAMRQDAPLPGTMLGKALEGLDEGTGTIRVLVMLR